MGLSDRCRKPSLSFCRFREYAAWLSQLNEAWMTIGLDTRAGGREHVPLVAIGISEVLRDVGDELA